jgi:hypothetical protein
MPRPPLACSAVAKRAVTSFSSTVAHAHRPGRFRRSRGALAGTRGTGAHALARAFSRVQGALERDVGYVNARTGPCVFASPGRPAKITHDMFCVCWRRVTLNASLRLDSLTLARLRSRTADSRCSGGSVPLLPTPPSRRRSVPNEGYSDSRERAWPALAITHATPLATPRIPVGVSGERAARSPERHVIGGIRERSRASEASRGGARRSRSREYPKQKTYRALLRRGALGSRKRMGQCVRSRTPRPALGRPGPAKTPGSD